MACSELEDSGNPGAEYLPECAWLEVCRCLGGMASGAFHALGQFAAVPGLQCLREESVEQLRQVFTDAADVDALNQYVAGCLSIKELAITLLYIRQPNKSAAMLREQLSAVGRFKAHNISEQVSFAEGVAMWWELYAEQRPLTGVWELPCAAHVITAVLSQAGESSDALLPIAEEHLLHVADQIVMGMHSLKRFPDTQGHAVRTGSLPLGAIFGSGLHVALLARIILPGLREHVHAHTGSNGSENHLLNIANDSTEPVYPELVEALHTLLFTQARKFEGLVRMESLRLPAMLDATDAAHGGVAQGSAWQVRELFDALAASKLGEAPGLVTLSHTAAALDEKVLQQWQTGLSSLRGHFPLRASVVFYCYGMLARRAWEDGFEALFTTRDVSADLIALHVVCVRYGGEVALHRQLVASCGVSRFLTEAVAVRREILLAFRELLRCETALAKWLMCPGYGSKQMASF